MIDVKKRGVICLLFLCTSSTLSLANIVKRPIPDKLFGITLGAIYDEESLVKELPVQKIVGMNSHIGFGKGEGIKVYFKPIEENKHFHYQEKRIEPKNIIVSRFFNSISKRLERGDNFYQSSFSIYLLPIIPDHINSLAELKNTLLKWQVHSVSWTRIAKDTEQRFVISWAENLCNTLAYGFNAKPQIPIVGGCVFNEGDKAIDVYGRIDLIILGYTQELKVKRHRDVNERIGNLEAKEILP